jgi:hypothetical protein
MPRSKSPRCTEWSMAAFDFGRIVRVGLDERRAALGITTPA